MLLTLLAFTASCKKNRTCSCTNPGGEYEAFTIKESKSVAEQECAKYYDDNFGNVTWSETVCSIK